MRIPPYWRKEKYVGRDRHGREVCYWAWGWSFQSEAEAHDEAMARAKRRFDAGDRREARSDYEYLEYPLREEIVETLAQDGELSALITRNRYGCLVLNTARACFVDVDYPPVKSSGLVDAVLLLLSSTRRKTREAELREAVQCRVRDWAGRNPDRAFRLYATAAGLRLLFTDKPYQPASGEVAELFEALGSDGLYRRLTVKQECFRARLTPKPWRCACPRPPGRYPWESEEAKRRYKDWLGEYQSRSAEFAVCRLVESFGQEAPHTDIQRIVAVHDAYTCRTDAAILA